MNCRQFKTDCVDPKECLTGPCQLDGERYWKPGESPPPLIGVGQHLRVKLRNDMIMVYEVLSIDEATRTGTLYPIGIEGEDDGASD